MCGIAAGAQDGGRPARSSSRHASGPATVRFAHCPVTGTTLVREDRYSHCSHSSNAAAVRSTPALVTFSQKCEGDRRATIPSSRITPFSSSSSA